MAKKSALAAFGGGVHHCKIDKDPKNIGGHVHKQLFASTARDFLILAFSSSNAHVF